MKIIIPSIDFSKKKITLLIFFITLLVIINYGCRKYVDIKQSSTQGTLETVEDCQLMLDNYTVMNTKYPSDQEVSADDYYLSDAGYNSGALTQTDRDLYVWAPNAIRPGAGPDWIGCYKAIYYANLVLEAVDKLKSGSTNQTALNNIRGSALFFRSFNFWQIAQLYAKPYTASSSGQDPGIPLRLNSDINGVSTRGTVEQTYRQITQDLLEAVGLLSSTSSVPSRPNKAAAYALLARVYLSMENYPQALTNASSALQLNSQLIDYNTLDLNSTTPFYPRFNKEVIFHSISSINPALDPNNGYGDYGNISLDLVNSYQQNDLRKSVFFKSNGDGTYRFSGNYEGTDYPSTFFNGLAVDELYLIRSECYARAGNVASAMSDLNTLLRTRWASNTYSDMSATNADDALAKVLSERRKELLMRGLRWTDLRRLNKDTRFAITLSRTVMGITYTLPPNDPRYTLLIPQEVINNSSITQNPR